MWSLVRRRYSMIMQLPNYGIYQADNQDSAHQHWLMTNESYWFRKGCFNQSYQITPKTKAYQLASKHNSFPNGTSFTHIWNTALIKTRFSVLSSHCFKIQLRKMLGASAVYLSGTKWKVKGRRREENYQNILRLRLRTFLSSPMRCRCNAS